MMCSAIHEALSDVLQRCVVPPLKVVQGLFLQFDHLLDFVRVAIETMQLRLELVHQVSRLRVVRFFFCTDLDEQVARRSFCLLGDPELDRVQQLL